MKGLPLTASAKLMFTVCTTLILFLGILAAEFADAGLGYMIITFDFLLAVIVLLSATEPETPTVNVMSAPQHVGAATSAKATTT